MLRVKNSKNLLLSLSVIGLAACSGGEEPSVNSDKTLVPMPPVSDSSSKGAVAQPVQKPMPLSKSDTLTPVMPSATAAENVTSPAAPLTMEERMTKVEQSVTALRSDYDRIMPAFASLNTTNERIQTLLDEIEKKTGQPVSEPNVPSSASEGSAAGEKAPPAAKAPLADPASAGGANTVTGLRIGEHGTKTRLVFDLSGKEKPDYKYDIDNAEKLLLVDISASSWAGSKESGQPRSPLVASWSVQKGAAGGASIAIQLKKGVKVVSEQYLKAEGKDPSRLVIDVAAAD